jgi:hypothetical protein
MPHKLRIPGPSMVVALVALFVALSGTAVAAGVPTLAKRALVADKAKDSAKLNGKTSAQLLATASATSKSQADAAAAAPGPASSAAGLMSVKSVGFSLAAQAEQLFTATCDAGSKAAGGGFNNPSTALVLSAGSYPTADGSGWTEDLINLSSSTTGAGQISITCVK